MEKQDHSGIFKTMSLYVFEKLGDG